MSVDQKPRRRNRKIIIKTADQIAGIEKASQLTKSILDMVAGRIGPGITTDQINTWVHQMTLDNNAVPAPLGYLGYPKSTCTSINNVICHGIPDDTILRSGDIVNVDVTCILDGYYGDASRMFLIGDVSPEARKLVEICQDCLMVGIEQVKPGNTFGDIGYHIQQLAESNNYSVVRTFTGHGIGIDFHEAPEVQHVGRPGQGPELMPNMVFTIEPMINAGHYECQILDDNWTAVTKDGSLSAQWEHTVAVTESGYKILTA